MKKVQDINAKLKALYENKEPDYLEEDDAKILRYEKQSIEWKERYDTDPEFRKIFEKAREKRTDEWRENVANANKTLKNNGKHNEDWYNAFLESRERLKADPEWQKMQTAKNKALPDDPRWREAHLKSRAPIKDKRTKWYKNIAEGNRKRGKLVATEGTPERENFMKGRENMKNNPVWRRNVILSKGGKPFKCPWGVYETPKQASEDSVAKTGVARSRKWIRIRLNREVKKGFEGFDYITWAEYDKIMGITGLPQE